MDYHSLKRRELQALCKEHNIPANSANAVLADKLSALLNEKPKPITTRKRTCMKSSIETTEGEPAASKREAKKVRFNPRNDLREYEPSGVKQKDTVTQTKSRRKSVANKPVVDNTTTVQLVNDSAQIPVKLTRSRVKDVEKGVVVDKETVSNVGKVTRSKAHALEVAGGSQREESRQSKRLNKSVGIASESVKELVVNRVRVTRSRTGTGHDVNTQVKKKSGKQVETDEQDVKPSVRATRSRRQSSKEDVENMVANPLADKKRTRSEMKATDVSHVAPVGKQEAPKRKLLRSRGAETVDEDEDEGDKVEVVNVSRVTRSKAPLATETTRRNSRYSTKKVEVQQLEEPSRMNTRRKSVMPKETKMVESPTVVKKQSKGQAKEDVIRSGKVASENESKEVTSGSPKSRKQRGTSIIEDQVIETEGGSLVDESPKRSTRSASKSEGKPVVKKQVESSLKKAELSGTKQSSTRGASSSTKRAKLSGMKQSDSEEHNANSSKEGTPVAKVGNLKLEEEVTPAIEKSARRFTRGAIGSERKEPSQSAIKELPQFSSAKSAKFRPDPVVNTAPGRFTRSGIKHVGTEAGIFSEKVGKKKQASQSARKRQSHDVAQMASPEVTEGGSDPDVGTVGVRSEIKQLSDDAQMTSANVTEVGPDPDVGTIGVGSEIKQPSVEVEMSSPEVPEVGPNPDVDTVGALSGIKQLFDEVQISSPEVAEVTSNPNVDTIGVRSAFKQPLDKVQMSSPEVEPNPDTDTVGVLSGIKQLFDEVHMPSPEVAEDEPNPDVDTIVSDGFHVQNQNREVNVESGIFSEATNLATSVLKSGRPDAKEEIDMTETVTISKGLETVTPAIEKSVRRFTRGAIGSERKEPSQSAIKEQPIAEVQFSSPKVAKFRHDSAVNTAPGRVTRGGIRHDGNAACSFSEKVGKKKQTRQSAYKKQPLEDAQIASAIVEEAVPDPNEATIGVRSEVKQPCVEVEMSSPEVAEVGSNPDVGTVGVLSGIKQLFDDVQMSSPEVAEVQPDLDSDTDTVEVGSAFFREVTSQSLGDVSASESVRLPRKDMENTSLVFGEKASVEVMSDADAHIENLTYETSATQCLSEALRSETQQNSLEFQSSNDETPLGKNLSHISMEPVSASDGSHVQNQNREVYVESGRPDAKEKEIDMTESVSISKGLETDVMSEEPLVSVGKVVVVEEGDNGDADNNCDSVSYDVGSSTIKRPKELETGSELSNANKTIEVPVSDIWDVQDGVSEHEKLTGNDNQATDEEDVGGDDSEPAQNEVLVRSCDQEPEQNLNVAVSDVVARADTLEESALDINKDVVSSILGNTYDTDAEDDSKNEQKLTEVDEGISTDMSNEKIHEEAGKSTWDDHTLDDQEQAVATDDLDSDSGKFMEDGSHTGVNVLDSELVAREEASPNLYTKGECPVDDADSDLPSIKKDDRNTQDETRKAGVFVDWGDYEYGMDDFEEPASANRSAEVAGDGGKANDRDLNFQSSARSSFSIEESSARNLEKNFSNATGGKSKQDVDKLKESANAANMTEEGFDWSDSYRKSFSTTPATTQIPHVKDVQEDATIFSNTHHHSSTETFDKTPGVTQISHVKDGREGAVANQDLYAGMKQMFTTPDAPRTLTSHVNVSGTNAVNSVNFTFPYGGCNEDIVTSGSPAREFNQPWGNEQLAFDGETQDSAVRGHEIYGVQSFEDDHLKLLFGDENVGGSIDASRSAKHSEFKGDHVNQIKQFEFLGEAAGTSHHDPSGLNDNSICSPELEKKEETLVKDHSAFDTGHV